LDALCEQLFGRRWADLDLEAVRRFLAERADEGLTWEATAERERSGKVLKEVCAFANTVRLTRRSPFERKSCATPSPTRQKELFPARALQEITLAPIGLVQVGEIGALRFRESSTLVGADRR